MFSCEKFWFFFFFFFLKQHLLSVHPDEPTAAPMTSDRRQCDGCLRKFSSFGNMRRHLRDGSCRHVCKTNPRERWYAFSRSATFGHWVPYSLKLSENKPGSLENRALPRQLLDQKCQLNPTETPVVAAAVVTRKIPGMPIVTLRLEIKSSTRKNHQRWQIFSEIPHSPDWRQEHDIMQIKGSNKRQRQQ